MFLKVSFKFSFVINQVTIFTPCIWTSQCLSCLLKKKREIISNIYIFLAVFFNKKVTYTNFTCQEKVVGSEYVCIKGCAFISY